MKKTLLPLLLSSILFADCTLQEEQEANNLWQNSQTMQGMQQYQMLKKASQVCYLDKIDVDISIFRIENDLKGDLSSEIIKKVNINLAEVRSSNNVLLERHTRKRNADKIKALTDQLVDMQILVEDNKEKLTRLNDYKNDLGPKKPIGRGKKIFVPIRFANGKDRVQGNNDIDALIRKIKHTLSKNPNAKFTITGYASSLGKAYPNESLSKRRAINTKKYIEKYIPKGNIITFGMGESDLICNSGFAENIGGAEYRCRGGSENEASSRRIEVLRRN